MNNVLKTICERYSCRDFADTPLNGEQIDTLVRAALASPSGLNRQPWHVIVVTDKALIDEMDVEGMKALSEAENKNVYERILSRGGKLFYNAPCMIIATSSDPGGAPMDCGILSQNIALAAHSIGLGNVICGLASVPINGPSGNNLKKRLKFPENHVFGISVLVGYAKSKKEPHELDFNKVTFIKTLRWD